MAGSSLRLEGDVRGLFRRMRDFAELDKQRLNAVLSEVARESTLERFRLQRSPEGKKWKPSIRAQQEGGVTLTKSAAMRNSIKSKSASTGFAVGTNKIQAATHQFGEKGREITIRAKTSKGLVFMNQDGQWVRKKKVTVKVKIPARPFLGLNDDDMKEIKATIEDFLGED